MSEEKKTIRKWGYHPTEDARIFELSEGADLPEGWADRKSTRLNSSHGYISYAVFCLKKKKKNHKKKKKKTTRTHQL